MSANAGIPPQEFLSKINKILKQKADSERAINNLQRYLSAGFSTSAIHNFSVNTIQLDIILELFSQSQYLADIIVREPSLFDWLVTSSALIETKTRAIYVEDAKNTIGPFQRIEKRANALRRFHRREILRIGARELLKEAEITTVTKELSWLADAILESVIVLGVESLKELCPTGLTPSFAIIGLGKLGGEELNFSSDIDLMFVYDLGDELKTAEEHHTIFSYYQRLAEFILRILTENSDEGHLYRVDMRLRPDGKSGSLVLPISGYVQYYENRGVLWESQMLTKARIVAGEKEVGNRFLDSIKPFVFPKTLKESPLKVISEMKGRIEEKTTNENIKLGSGGIRDIEFIAQALLLLNAGSNPKLRERGTLSQLDMLLESELIKNNEYKELRKAYLFFRTVEHRLQLLYGLQTHSLPETEQEMQLLSNRLGFRTATEFDKVLNMHRLKVRKIFHSVFKKREQEKKPTISFGTILFFDEKISRKNIEYLCENLQIFSNHEFISNFRKLLKQYYSGDIVLQNLVKFSDEQSLRRTLEIGLSDKSFSKILLTILSRSQEHTEILLREPLLFESLFTQTEEFFQKEAGWSFLREGNLAKYRQYNEFKYGMQFFLGKVTIADITYNLSTLAEEIVGLIIRETINELPKSYSSIPFCLIALGKFGGRELTFHSDLDLIFFCNASKNSSTLQKMERIITTFSTKMWGSGNDLYRIDLRLRPEGNASPLPVDINYLEQYYESRASLWERQALLKSRIIFGDEKIAKLFESVRLRAFSKNKLSRNWIHQIRSMRDKIEKERALRQKNIIEIKCSSGGLIDLEYVVQALQLNFLQSLPKLDTTGTFTAIKQIADSDIISRKHIKVLRHNLDYLRSLETYIRMNTESSDSFSSGNVILTSQLASAMGEKSSKTFLNRIESIKKEKRKLLIDIFEFIESQNA
jgi:glutamate-ammonia-ligase adenylyltransferase